MEGRTAVCLPLNQCPSLCSVSVMSTDSSLASVEGGTLTLLNVDFMQSVPQGKAGRGGEERGRG